MEKVVRTTYRKLYKMSRRIDASVAMRSMLVCSPLQVYDQSSGEWIPLQVTKVVTWTDSRTFLDNVIRRLNNGYQFYIPPLPAEATRAVAVYQNHCSNLLKDVESTEGSHETPFKVEKEGSLGTESNPAPVTPTVAEEAAAAAAAAGNGGAATLPLCILPYTTLSKAVRQIYMVTPFSVSNLTNGFEAVKELSYICEVMKRRTSDCIKPPPRTLVTEDDDSSGRHQAASPLLHRSLEVSPLNNSLFQDLDAEPRLSLSRRRRRSKKIRRPIPGAASPLPSSENAEPLPGKEFIGNSFDDAVLSTDMATEERERTDEVPILVTSAPEEAASIKDRDESVDARGDFPPLPSSAEVSQGSSSAADVESLLDVEVVLPTPTEVQLLLAHPQLSGFFQHTVLLIVRHANSMSAAFVLNKPLRNDEGVLMPIHATVRLNRVHSIFHRHLKYHTLMIGGPVMSGGVFDENIFVLHRVPGVPGALPVGADLWFDGDLDVLAEKLDAGEASAAEDVVVLCGFAGWSLDQLKGEVMDGTWLVAKGGEEGTGALNSCVFSLARDAGSVTATHTEESISTDDVTTESEMGEQSTSSDTPESISERAQRAADAAMPGATRNEQRRQRAAAAGMAVDDMSQKKEVLSWVQAYAALGEPYADIAMNQKNDDNDFSSD